MIDGPDRRGYLWWAVLVIPLWIALVLCAHWEPVMRDGWGHIGWYRDHPVRLDTLYEFCKVIYLEENPRLGQFVTLLLYARGPYHAIVTPVIELALVVMLGGLALGRWPSVRRPDDAFVTALVAAMVVACAPQIGPMLLYRPFTGNYTIGFAINLLWLMPYRLEVAAPRPRRWWLAPMMLVLGFVAGLCNEHTGLAFLAMAVLASLVAGLRGGGWRLWMPAGIVGLTAGYIALLTAPGQHLRYAGLANQAGILDRIIDRGVGGNLAVIAVLVGAVAVALPVIAVGVIERRTHGRPAQSRTARWTPAVLVLAGFACALTLLASPKIGPRLYFASTALVVAGVAGWLAVELRSPWSRRLCGVLAAGTLLFVGTRLVLIHRVVGPLGAIRRDRIEHGAPGSVVTVPGYPYEGTRYFLGDDFLVATLRQAIAVGYHLKAVELEAR